MVVSILESAEMEAKMIRVATLTMKALRMRDN